MKQIAVVVSDLHMGFNPRIDNFAGDEKFAPFCQKLAAFCQEKGVHLTFILNGDIFEMWEMAPEDETRPDTAVAHISANIFFPAVGAVAEASATERGKWQIDQALARHTAFADGIGRLLTIDPDLHYVAGNHDHAMVNPALQQHLRERLSALTNVPITDDRLTFSHWHSIPDLKLYVEHGHQFADSDSSYADVTDWRVEAPGYYFLRYVYSRIEGMPDLHVPFGQLVHIILNLIFHPQVIDHRIKQYLYEYFAEHESLGFPLASGPSVPFVGHILPAIYEHWKAHGRPLSGGSAAFVETCRDLSGKAQLESTDGTEEVEANLTHHNLKKTRTGLPGRLLNYISAHARDRYAMGFRDRFAQQKGPFPRLSPEDGMTVVGGHTHREHHSRLLDAFMATVRYINCGSWASGPKRLGYSVVTDDTNEFRNRLLYLYR